MKLLNNSAKSVWAAVKTPMRSSAIDLKKYDSDKIHNRYLDWYDPLFEPLVWKQINLLEIGVHKGGSLLLWRDYFPCAKVVGIDLEVPPGLLQAEEHIHVFKGNQGNTRFLSQVAENTAPDGFDIIIDDGSHIADLTRISFWYLFENHLKPGGIYAIEDWGTGYWDDWPDGRTYRPQSQIRSLICDVLKRFGMISRIPSATHRFGMVGFVKELIDEQGAADLTRATFTGRPGRSSRFENMTITPSIVFVRKVGPDAASDI